MLLCLCNTRVLIQAYVSIVPTLVAGTRACLDGSFGSFGSPWGGGWVWGGDGTEPAREAGEEVFFSSRSRIVQLASKVYKSPSPAQPTRPVHPQDAPREEQD